MIKYLYKKSKDPGDQKSTFLNHKQQNVVKFFCLTSMNGKAGGILPLAASQSPRCGDTYLVSSFIRQEDEGEEDKCQLQLRSLLEGKKFGL